MHAGMQPDEIGPLTSIDYAHSSGLSAGAPRQTKLRVLAKRMLPFVVGLWIVSGGFVLIDPSPYEALFFVVLPVAVFAGMGVHRKNLNIFLLLLVFLPFAIIGGFQVTHMSVAKGITYGIVTAYLWFTSFFVANYIAGAPRERLRTIMLAYTGVAVFAALVGTLAYLRIIPDLGQFLEFGRARATFKDPNVYAPFLIVPAMFALQRALMATDKRAIYGAIVFGILFMGIFASFSRAAWGLTLLSALIVFVSCFVLEAGPKHRARMTMLAVGGAAILLLALLALLSIESVRELFLIRASFDQSYDTGETGRFARQALAMDIALANPWGIGPLEFRNMRIIEEPHNTYVNVLHAYGWGGGLAYYALIWMTLKKAAICMTKASPNRLLLIPLFSVFISMIIESAIIDTDHWRHNFLIIGMVWGVCAGYERLSASQSRRSGTLI